MFIITGESCMPCKLLKQWLDENNIRVEEKLSDDCMDVVEALKVKQTPTLVLDDNTIISGLSNIQEYFEEQM